MALMSPTRPEDQLQMTMGTQPEQLGMVQHPMHAMIAPLEPAPPELDPALAMGMSPDAPPAIPEGKKPQVKQMSAVDQYKEKLAQKQMSDIQKDENPYGSANNHPGFFGKLLHGLSVATGGPNRRQFAEAERNNQIQGIEKEQGAQEQQQAQARHLNAESQALENPPADSEKPEKPYTIQTDEGVLQWNPDDRTWTPVTVGDETAMPFAKPSATRANAFQHVSGTSQGKQVFANYDPSKGVFTDLQGNVLTDFHPTDKAMQGVLGQYAPVRLLQGLLNTAYNDNPALLPYVGKLAQQIMSHYGAGAGAEQAFGAAPEGQPHNETGNPIGLKMPEAPTGMTRSRGQFAEAVIPAIHDAQSQIQELGDELGPMAGRYNELATSKIGAFGPQFTGLQTTLHNVATAWMRLHANSESAREDFINQLRAAQSPANLIAALNAIDKQATDYVKMGQGKPHTMPNQTPQRPANVPPNAQYITDPKTGKKGWAW